MSKKSSTFAPEMKKKQYTYPIVEVLCINMEEVMQMAGVSDKLHPAPKRRKTDVF